MPLLTIIRGKTSLYIYICIYLIQFKYIIINFYFKKFKKEEALAEKCSLTESYQIVNPKFYHEKNSQLANRLNNFNGNNNKCIKQPEMNIVSKCSDNTMLRLDFQDCLNSPVATDHKNNLNSFSQFTKNSSETKPKSINLIANG